MSIHLKTILLNISFYHCFQSITCSCPLGVNSWFLFRRASRYKDTMNNTIQQCSTDTSHYLTNRFHVVIRLFTVFSIHRSEMTPKCGTRSIGKCQWCPCHILTSVIYSHSNFWTDVRHNGFYLFYIINLWNLKLFLTSCLCP